MQTPRKRLRQFCGYPSLVAAILAGLCLGPMRSAQETTRPNKWAKDIEAFEASDKVHPPPQGAVLFAGSSSIRLWKTLAQDFPNVQIINRGFGGSQIKDSTDFAERIILPCRPRAVALYAGDNDIAAGLSPEKVLEDFQVFAAKIHAALPETRVAFISIKPSLARWKLADKIKSANSLIERFCRSDSRLAYVNIFDPMLGEDAKPRPELFVNDGLHLSPAGYELWTKQLRPFVER